MKRGRKKLTKKRKLELREKYNKQSKRNFVNLVCSKCGREYHIRVNNKDDWGKKDKTKYICVVCR